MTNLKKEIEKKKGVFIERAEPLTKEGIFAMGLNDREYFIFCEGKKQALSTQKQETLNLLDDEIKWIENNRSLFAVQRKVDERLSQLQSMKEEEKLR